MPMFSRPLVDSPETYHKLMRELAAHASTTPLTIQEIAENVVEIHYGVATSENREVSGGDSYSLSQANLLAMIRLAYPDTDAQEVYEIWVDCMEPLAFCARAWMRYQNH